MRLLSKRGKPLLLLPPNRKPAAATFDLYPAQTPRARALRSILRWLTRAGLPAIGETVELTFSPEDALVKFLAVAAEIKSLDQLRFGILAGNPGSPGQRFLLLLFDDIENPITVVKAGITAQAQALVEREAAFLKKAPPELPGFPQLRSEFRDGHSIAFALDYYGGHSPRANEDRCVGKLLSSWIRHKTVSPLKDLAEWQALERALPGHRLVNSGAHKIREHLVRPCIQHGDFARWNVKVHASGSWTVLDWERGQLEGIPAWDWFHYYLQSAILVEKLSGDALIERAVAILQTNDFE